MITSRIDYLQGKTRLENQNKLDEFLDSLGQWDLTKKPFTCQIRYDHGFTNNQGLRGGFTKSSGKMDTIFQLSGEFWSDLNEEEHWDTLTKFKEIDFRCSRIDIAIDDYKRRAKTSQIWAAAEKGDYALIESRKIIQSSPMQDCNSKDGSTIYFGSPKSQKLIRFYNAELLHSIPADRWEIQYRGNKAKVAFPEIVKMQCCRKLASCLPGAIDFIKKEVTNSGGKIKRQELKRLPWWNSLCNEIEEEVRFIYKKPPQKIEKIIDWIDRQVIKNLAILDQALGRQHLEVMIQEGTRKFTPEDRLLINEYKSKPISLDDIRKTIGALQNNW